MKAYIIRTKYVCFCHICETADPFLTKIYLDGESLGTRRSVLYTDWIFAFKVKDTAKVKRFN